MLAPFACDPHNSRGRLYEESTTPYRNEFQRDKDRIIHSNAFRRLEYKTQVYVNHEGDHYRNRLTHSIEVASIARSIATELNVSADLAEAIALSDRVIIMSQRPGRIIADVNIDIPRPRHVRELQSDNRFLQLYGEIWKIFESGVSHA